MTRARFVILFLVSIVTCFNYLGRANLAVAAPYLQAELGISPAMLGVVFSAFSWSYTMLQIPSGWILDRFGPRLVHGIAILGWSLFSALTAVVSGVAMLAGCRLAVGFFSAPTFPANGRVVATWFPANERGLAIGAYSGAQHFGLAFLTPVLTWLVVTFGWPSVFIVTGMLGAAAAAVWYLYYRDPGQHQGVSQAELAYIRQGGGLSDTVAGQEKISWQEAKQLFKHRQLWGMYIGQFAQTATLLFFLTWFPSYLVAAKGMAMLKAGFYASVPFLAAIIGVLAGGKWSDWMLVRGCSLSAARKIPIVLGLLLSCCIILANYTNDINLVITIMSLAFMGQGMSGSISWALLSDIAPRKLVGLTGGVFNFCANLGGTITPLAVGFIVNTTQSFEFALLFISIIALIGAFAYIFIVGRPYRIEIPEN